MPMIIRISGHPGSGTTTFCKRFIEAHDGYRYIYMGAIIEELAQAEGLTKEAFHMKLADRPDEERALDAHLEERMLTEDDLVAEGRMAPFLACGVPHLNILFTVDDTISAQRQLERPYNHGRSVSDMIRETAERKELERGRYRTLYGVEDHFATEAYDIVIDTTRMNRDEVYETVCALIAQTPPRPPRTEKTAL